MEIWNSMLLKPVIYPTSTSLPTVFAVASLLVASAANHMIPTITRITRKIIAGKSPPVTVSAPQTTLARTRVIPNSQYPFWDDHFRIPLAHPMSHLEFRVKDDDLFGAQLMGKVKIPAETIATGEVISGWFPIIGSSRKPPNPDTALRIHMKFSPCENNPLYKRGIASDPQHLGVRNSYFPVRKGSSVKLYQDAHVSNDVKFPEIELENGTDFEHNKCWEDICYAISEAHHLVYIVMLFQRLIIWFTLLGGLFFIRLS